MLFEYRELTEQTKYRVALMVSAIALLLVSPVSWNYFDLHLFLLTWNDALTHGWNIYAVGNSNYPPLATYLFIGLETIARRTASTPLVTGTRLTELNWVRLVARIPLLIAYLWTGRLLFHRWGWSVARYWLFTPPLLLAALLIHVHPAFTVLTVFSWTALIPLHVFFGYQFDLLVVPFTLLALFSLQDDHPVRFGFYLAVGSLIKFFPIILLPLGLMRFGWRKQLLAMTVFGSLVGLTIAPFVVSTPHEFYYQLFGFQSQRFPQGLSIFHLPLLAVRYDIAAFPAVLKWLWQVVWLPVYGLILLLAFWRTADEDIVVVFAAVLLSFVMLNKIGNLNYMVWAWPFLLVLISRNRISMKYVTALVVTTTMYPVLVYLPAAIANKPIFIVQKLAWYNARTFLLNSFQGSAYGSVRSVIFFLEAAVGPQAAVIYQHRFLLFSLLIVAHATIQLRLVVGLAAHLGGGQSLKEIATEVGERPKAAIARVFSETRPD